MKTKKQDSADGTVRFASGATVGHGAPRYDLIPGSFLRRVADRFELGAPKFGDLTYRQRLRDKGYILDRMNHLQGHVQALMAPKNSMELIDDNVAAIGWAAAFLCEVEADPEGCKILEEIRKERGAV